MNTALFKCYGAGTGAGGAGIKSPTPPPGPRVGAVAVITFNGSGPLLLNQRLEEI
jgi:hypothetical protein